MPFKKKHVLMVQRVGSGGERRNITNFADVLAKVQEMMVTEFPDEVLVHWTGEGGRKWRVVTTGLGVGHPSAGSCQAGESQVSNRLQEATC